jgi:hypothetical protein
MYCGSLFVSVGGGTMGDTTIAGSSVGFSFKDECAIAKREALSFEASERKHPHFSRKRCARNGAPFKPFCSSSRLSRGEA